MKDDVSTLPDNDLLDRMQYRADPLADDTIGQVLDDWQSPQPLLMAAASAPGAEPQAAAASLAAQWQPQWEKLKAVNRVFAQWKDNASLLSWQPPAGVSPGVPDVTAPLRPYVQAADTLPEWADRAKMARAEELFTDYGVLSVTLLFCSSLPECYVVPDLAAVLNVTGQLVTNTDYRIRSTGAMVFPVMMKGGMTTPAGGGLAQIFKVRLIHASIRNLVLRGTPGDAHFLQGTPGDAEAAGVQAAPDIPPMEALRATGDMHHALFAHGWNTARDGLPCNQEELAYTLLTFSYVFLRSMRKLGIGFTRPDEEAYLHAWNVAGHLLGIDRSLMVDTMEEAEVLYARMQARGREDWARKTAADPATPDPRPALGNALMQAMEQVIPVEILRPFPVLLTRHLCGPDSSRDLGLNERVSWISRALFKGSLLVIRGIDSIGRRIVPGFSLSRLLTRVVGYQFITKLLMDQTRPLKLPEETHDRVKQMIGQWHQDPMAGKWVNALEDRMTVQGIWGAGK